MTIIRCSERGGRGTGICAIVVAFTFGWLYPLVEFNWSALTHNRQFDLPKLRRGFFDLGDFESTGTVVSVSPGINAVLIPNRLELGLVYTTPIHTQRNFDFNTTLVKMTIRY